MTAQLWAVATPQDCTALSCSFHHQCVLSWAARCATGLPIELTTKDVVFCFCFFSQCMLTSGLDKPSVLLDLFACCADTGKSASIMQQPFQCHDSASMICTTTMSNGYDHDARTFSNSSMTCHQTSACGSGQHQHLLCMLPKAFEYSLIQLQHYCVWYVSMWTRVWHCLVRHCSF